MSDWHWTRRTISLSSESGVSPPLVSRGKVGSGDCLVRPNIFLCRVYGAEKHCALFFTETYGVVPWAGVEPARRVRARDFKSRVSTDSTTKASEIEL